jgi:hypothetical protein
VKKPATIPFAEQFVDAGVEVVAVNQIRAELSESNGGVAHRIATFDQMMKLIPVTTFPAGQKTLLFPPPTAVVFEAEL